MKRILSLFLIFLLVVSSVPSTLAYTPGDNWCINCPVAPDGMGVLCAECMMCPHCEGCICVEENDYSAGTNVEYDAEADNDGDGQPDNTEAYTITVPAKLTPGGEGTVTLSGTWASNRMVTVTAESSVTLLNNLAPSDQKILDVLFNGISKAGSNTNAQTFTEKISVANINAALFGTWKGRFNYNVVSSDIATKAEISVQATDKDGNDLNAQSFVISGAEKDKLLSELQKSDLIGDVEEIDGLIEVKSDDFDDLADTTFDVSSIAQPGDKVVILHYNEETCEWEYISEETVNDEGKVNADFSSYSPVAFVVVKQDGSMETITSYPMYTNVWYTDKTGNSSIKVGLLEGSIVVLGENDFYEGMKLLAGGEEWGPKFENNTLKYRYQETTLGEVVVDTWIEVFTVSEDKLSIYNDSMTLYLDPTAPMDVTYTYTNDDGTDFIFIFKDGETWEKYIPSMSAGQTWVDENEHIWVNEVEGRLMYADGTPVKVTDKIIAKYDNYYYENDLLN